MSEQTATSLATDAGDYSNSYYVGELGTYLDYDWATPHWQSFFRAFSYRLVAATNPSTVFDVGCAKGMLVQALAELGIEAFGSDISPDAIESSHHEVRSRLHVASATEPFEARYDLITCIEVLEHMAQSDVEIALDNMASATDKILLSSTPDEFSEPTHINIRTPADWAASMAERGFYRRTDVDLSFLSKWAVLYERANLSNRDVVHRYEGYLYPLRIEVIEKRIALLESNRKMTELAESIDNPDSPGSRKHQAELDGIAELEGRLEFFEGVAEERLEHIRRLEAQLAEASEQTSELQRLVADGVQDVARAEKALELEHRRAIDAQHRLLTVRDHAIGAEASAATALAERNKAIETLEEARTDFTVKYHALGGQCHELSQQLHAVMHSERWRAGGIALSPAVGIKKVISRSRR